MKSILTCAVLATLAAATCSHAGGTSPLPIMGTWTGTAKCKYITSSGEKGSASSALTIRILTGGEVSLAEFDSSLFGAGGPGGLCGLNIAQAGKTAKGAVSFVMPDYDANGTVFDPDLPVVGLFLKSVKLFEDKNGITGTLKGSGPIFPFHNGEVGNCSIKAQRTSTAMPMVDFALFNDCFPF